ncbi:MAG: hypothetical protein QW165_04500 [Candidatus Woesearchaeota archaeon]
MLLVVSIPRAIGFVLSRVQEAHRQKGKLYSINAWYAGIEIAALLIMVPMYGIYGMVAAKGISNIAYSVLAWKNLY